MVCDGAKTNSKFFNSLGAMENDKRNGIVYKTRNRYCHDRFIYFMSDVPHLIKTTHNCKYAPGLVVHSICGKVMKILI